jgi:hypothetical protein
MYPQRVAASFSRRPVPGRVRGRIVQIADLFGCMLGGANLPDRSLSVRAIWCIQQFARWLVSDGAIASGLASKVLKPQSAVPFTIAHYAARGSLSLGVALPVLMS